MRNALVVLALVGTFTTVSAQMQSPGAVEADISRTLRPYTQMGRAPFLTRWPGGQTKEAYSVSAGKVSYTKFFPTGSVAITYQRTNSGAVAYEKKYGDGKDAVIIKKDERILDYTSYWPSGRKKGKFQRNYQTKDHFYLAHDPNGRQVYP